MGKTARGAVWLAEDMLSAYDYWQFWRNTQDADVGRFLRIFTELSISEIAALEALEGQEINDAKIALANACTALLHGAEAARKAERTARETFAQGQASHGLPGVEVTAAQLSDGLGVPQAFVLAGLAKSNKEVRRLIAQGGARINDQPIADEERVISQHDVVDSAVKLSAGKKRHALLKVQD